MYKQIKVLYITTVPTPYKVALFEELGRHCDLTVIFENKEVSYRQKEWMKQEFVSFKAVFLKGIKIKDKKISCGIFKYIENEEYDIIIVGVYSTISQMLAQIYMKIKKISYILSSDGGMIKNEGKISYAVKRYFISSAQEWLSTGKVTSEYLIYYGAKSDHIYTYPFSSVAEKDVLVAPDSFEIKQKFKCNLGMEEKCVVVSVGQFIYRKGFDVLIKAASKLPEIGIYIIGGEATEEYRKLKEQYHAYNVHFVGFKSKEELSEYYRAADLFVLPTREDIWGLVVNEAMAYGLPVITTEKCVAGLEMVSDGLGEIVGIDSVEELVAAMEKWNDANRRKRAENLILETARSYTIETMAQKHFKIFTKIMHDRRE